MHPTDSVQIDRLYIHLQQKGPNSLTRAVRFYFCSFKDAEKQYFIWEKGLLVVNTAFQEAEEAIHQQSLILRRPFKVIKPVLAETRPPDGVAKQASVHKWFTQIEH